MNRRLHTTVAFGCGQGGAVLFVSLVILLILSLLAIVTVNTSLTETKMASGMRNMQLAQFAADSALNEAEMKIASIAAAYGAGQVCSRIACAVRNAASPADAADFMHSAAAKDATISFRVDLSKLKGDDESARLAELPTYVIEDLGPQKQSEGSSANAPIPPSHAFRITARGVGGTANFVQIVENVYSIPDQNAASQ